MKPGYIRLGLVAVSSLTLITASAPNAYALDRHMVQGEPISFYSGKFAVSTETDDRLPNADELLSCFQRALDERFPSDQQRIAALQKVTTVRVVRRSNGLVRTGRTVRKWLTLGLWKGKPGDIGPTISGGVLTIVANEETECDVMLSRQIKTIVSEAPRLSKRQTGQGPDGGDGTYVNAGLNKPGGSDRYAASLNNPVADITAQAALDSAKQEADSAAIAAQNAQARVDAMGPHAEVSDQQAAAQQGKVRAEAEARLTQAQKGYHEQRLARARDTMRTNDPNSPTFKEARDLADQSKAAIEQIAPPSQPTVTAATGGTPVTRNPAQGPNVPQAPVNTAPIEVTAANEAYPEGDQKSEALALQAAKDQKVLDTKARIRAEKAMTALNKETDYKAAATGGTWSSLSRERQMQHRTVYMDQLTTKLNELVGKRTYAELDAAIADKKVEARIAADKARITNQNPGVEVSDDDMDKQLLGDGDLGTLRALAKTKRETADVAAKAADDHQIAMSKELDAWAKLATYNYAYVNVDVPGKPESVRVWTQEGFLNAKGYTWNKNRKIWVFTGYPK